MEYLKRLFQEKAWDGLALVSATIAGIVARNLLESAWRARKQDDPPDDPTDPSVDWWDGLTWTVATGVAVGVARLVARRGAAEGWRKVRGEYPGST